MNFAKRIKELRISKNLTQAKLAEVLHVTQPAIARWEKGIDEPDFQTLIKIAEYFGETVGYVLGTED